MQKCTFSIVPHVNRTDMNKFNTVLLISFLISLTIAADHSEEESPIAKTKYGDVRGTIMKSRKGKLYASFRGIPYTRPPIGSLRFKAPEEPERWNYIRNATEDAPVCIQQDYLFRPNPRIEGSEDCLYINVYSPKTLSSVKKTGKLLPVLVFIHYGGFMAGSSRSDIIGPEYFMDHDVVFVSFNYRLGVMGFLSTYDDEAPGNWGLKDQVAALKWVKNNIQFFGGNNKRVTIAGQSAGAGSVHHLILSPASKGLFQAAISMSGSALAAWSTPLQEIQLNISIATAAAVQCRDLEDTKNLVACLRNVSATTLVDAANVFRSYYSEPLTPYFMAIEKKSARNPNPFITENPYTTILNGNFEKVPWIVGVVTDEGILRASPYMRNEKRIQEINSDFDMILKERIGIQFSVELNKTDSVWAQIKDFYFGGKTELDAKDSNSVKGLIDLYSDRFFVYSAYQTLLLHKFMGHKHIFAYNFNYRGKYTFGDLFALTPNDINYEWGVSHCDDLLYLFNSPGRFHQHYELPKNDLKMSEILLNFFMNFVHHRDPTPKRIWNDKQRWEEIPDSKSILPDSLLHYLDISGSYEQDVYNFSMRNDFYSKRVKFWKSLPIFENSVFNEK